MTDSMKFGPEWLRNMSADSTASNSMNIGGQIINSAGVSGSGGSGGGGGFMAPSNSNSNINNSSISSSNVNNNLHNNINISSSAASRNTFPEFRYGREEMLLLFDRNCNIPEILPSYKNLFVERVQFPLALVPSTDEEMIMQATAPPTQRPAWLQRSPVGFSTTTRGTGRGGSMERGRMRGKSVYHPVFQRPNAMFEEDQRSTTTKTDRSWAERNGGAAGDSVVTGPSTVGGLGSDAWNGNTPSSSPRREFSNHPRNMENWRRSRNEDGSGDATTTTFSADGGWRMNSSGFQNTHTRWGRSTSWRDDDLANNNENSGIGVSGTPFTAGGGIMMQRSYSTISTSHGERIGHQNVAKQTSGHPTGGSGTTRSISVTASGTRNSVCGNIWPNNITASAMSTNNTGDGANDDLALPEWAMENPSDIGGTFDASGAFHGAVDDDDEDENDDDHHEHHHHHDHDLSVDASQDENKGENVSETKLIEKSFNTSEDHSKKSPNEIYKNNSVRETENCMLESSSPSPASSSTLHHEKNNDNLADCDKRIQDNRSTGLKETATDIIQENVSQNVANHREHGFNKDSSTIANVKNYSSSMKAADNVAANNNAGDYAERMMKVTDDMIEKLIMDDEDAKDDHMKSLMSPGGNKLNTQHAFVSVLQQQQQQNSNHQPVSPALVAGAGPAGPPNMSIPALYNMAGMMVDHTHNMAALHQLQQQQMAAVAAVAIGLQPPPPPPPHPLTSSAPTDLWLYRDPQAKVQGPFSALEMTEWYRAGYFNENLFVRRVCDTRYRPLGELIKICNGQMPFNHSHLIPIDLNPSPMTPPLAPNMAAQPTQQTTNDFVMKTLTEQHQQQHQKHEELKGNVTAAADSLSNALKSLINSVDMSQVLNMHFQTLQERFIRSQEIDIVNELSKNECFQRMTAAEQDAIVRTKLQLIILPEYLTNLTGLSNSLAALNPTAGTQLYDTIAECSKKEQLFSNQHQQHQQSQTHQQRPSHHNTSSTPYINTDDYMMKTKTANHDLGSNDLLNEFNLRMFLNNGSETTGGVATPNSHANEFLNEQQLFGATAAPPNHPNNTTSQSPMMQMWMNQITANQSNHVQQPQQQQPIMSGQQQHAVNNQWLNGPLVGISSIGMAREQQHSGAIIGSPKPIPTSMWDVATLEQHVQVQQQQLQQQKQQEQQLQQHLQQQNFEHNRRLKETAERPQQDSQQLDINKQNVKQHVESKLGQQQQGQQKSNDLQKQQDTTKVSANDINKQEQQQRQSQQALAEKSSHLNNNNNKRNSNNTIKQSATKPKDDQVIYATNKKTEEERRREQVEEKRRQKEDRKRQQMEEDKRRQLQAEEEKRRQVQEEEKRQQQIQAQRRKALMSANNSTNSNNNNSSNELLQPNSSTNSVGNQSQKSNTKEQQRVQSSVAPWSTAAKSQGPGLAEIQKAERRERRADQQRQLEIQEKQMRALAAAAETQDPVLKWNAAPVPVKSFAEIQAEEAKHLAHEQIELQRRKEQEASSTIINLSSGVATTPGGLNNTSNMSNIWSGTKIWGTSANTTGFWEEPLKFNNNNITVTAATLVAQSSSLMQPKPSTLLQQQHTQQPNKNIKKSQSVTVMQNTISHMPSTSGVASSNQKKQIKLQKSDSGNTDHKKAVAKTVVTTINKWDDYEAEFINWCTKSLNNMNTTVDVPTFVSFLRDLESPYEVKDYIREYLGESKEYIDFFKQFLERRSKYKNLQRAQNAHNDDLCKPALAITPSANDNSENKGKQKKVKKNKMTKLDARILGFSVTAAEGRINVGDRDYVDAP